MILVNEPNFFENMVVDPLLKMGYGYDKTSGIVTQKTCYGGIDVIINADALGMDTIYIQAKRYKSDHKTQSIISGNLKPLQNVCA